MMMSKEMMKLRKMLTKAGIEWYDYSDPITTSLNGISLQTYRTKFDYRENHWSVIHGFGTYGGWSSLKEDEGLLELMSEAVNGGEPVGCLTAEEVMEYVTGVNK